MAVQLPVYKAEILQERSIVTSAADAGRQKAVLAAIVELELHQRIFETDWRILPIS
jgi:hypothetical protein